MKWIITKILKGAGIAFAAIAVDVMVLRGYTFAALITAVMLLFVMICYIGGIHPPASSAMPKKHSKK